MTSRKRRLQLRRKRRGYAERIAAHHKRRRCIASGWQALYGVAQRAGFAASFGVIYRPTLFRVSLA